MYQRIAGALFISRKVSNFHKKLKDRITLFRGASAFLVSVTAGGVLLYYESYNLQSALCGVSQSKVIDHEKFRKPSYIYLSEVEDVFGNIEGSHESVQRKPRDAPHNSQFWLSWLQSRSRDPHTLLRLTQSEQQSVRHLGVEALAAQHHWHDWQYLMVAQACDWRTLIGLARSANIDSRFFLNPPLLPIINESMEDELQWLLRSLPMTEIDKCTQYFTYHAMAEGKALTAEREKQEAVWSFDESGMMSLQPPVSESASTRHIANCLHALFTHSKVSSHCREIVNHNGLLVLRRIYDSRGRSLKICRNIARILSNIALQEQYHEDIISAGWVTILAKWIKSADLALSMVASKALANLDGDCGSDEKYSDGIHVYHPTYRYSEPLQVDVVFVHGLLGGPFKTWRQQDPKSILNQKQNQSNQAQPNEAISPDAKHQPKAKGVSHLDYLEEVEARKDEEETECWPKDWLAKDLPNMRLLTLEYDTHLTEWAPKCPFDSQKRSLAHRSNVILQKLKDAGLGQRPIIWIGHSMGGLIIKNMLVLAYNKPGLRDIVDKSKGIIFYSVPHHGSPLAPRSAQARYILYPSVEVEELVPGSHMLTGLHNSFTELMFDKGIPLLSFGEGKKSDLPLNFKEFLVPPESSYPGFGEYHMMAEMDHLDVCKPQSRTAPLYRLSREFICDCIPHLILISDNASSILEGMLGE